MNFPCTVFSWQEFTTIAFLPEAADGAGVGQRWGRERKEGGCQASRAPEVQFQDPSDSKVSLGYLKLRLHKNSTSALNHDSFRLHPNWAKPPNYNDPERGLSVFLFLLYGCYGESERRKAMQKAIPREITE